MATSGPARYRSIVAVLTVTTALVVVVTASCASSGARRDDAVAGDPEPTSSTVPASSTTVGPPPMTATTMRSTEPRSTAGTSGSLLVVIGDSITNEGRLEVATALGVDHRVVIDGRSGYRIMQQYAAAQWAASLAPRIAIVELGTNDAYAGQDPAQSAADLRRLVALFDGAECVILVTVATDLPSTDAAFRAREFDRSVHELAATDPRRLHVVDVDTVVREAQSDPTFVGPFTYDGVHPTAAAHARLAAAYARAVAACE